MKVRKKLAHSIFAIVENAKSSLPRLLAYRFISHELAFASPKAFQNIGLVRRIAVENLNVPFVQPAVRGYGMNLNPHQRQFHSREDRLMNLLTFLKQFMSGSHANFLALSS